MTERRVKYIHAKCYCSHSLKIQILHAAICSFSNSDPSPQYCYNRWYNNNNLYNTYVLIILYTWAIKLQPNMYDQGVVCILCDCAIIPSIIIGRDWHVRLVCGVLNLCIVVDQWPWVDGGTAVEGLVRQPTGGGICDRVWGQWLQVCHCQGIRSHGEQLWSSAYSSTSSTSSLSVSSYR